MAKSKTRIMWLSKSNDEAKEYELWFKEPTLIENRYWDREEPYTGVFAADFCPDLFEKAYPNCKLEPGKCRRVKITMVFG